MLSYLLPLASYRQAVDGTLALDASLHVFCRLESIHAALSISSEMSTLCPVLVPADRPDPRRSLSTSLGYTRDLDTRDTFLDRSVALRQSAPKVDKKLLPNQKPFCMRST